MQCVRQTEQRPALRAAMGWSSGDPGVLLVCTQLSCDLRGLPHSLDCGHKPMRLVRNQGGNRTSARDGPGGLPPSGRTQTRGRVGLNCTSS